MTGRTCASCTSCHCSLRARVNNLDLPIYTNRLKAEKQHIQVRRVLSKYDLISTLYEHRFSTSGSVYVLGDVDHFVVVGGLILRSWSGGQRGRLLCLRLTPVWHTVPKFRFNLRSSPTELGLFSSRWRLSCLDREVSHVQIQSPFFRIRQLSIWPMYLWIIGVTSI